MNDSNPVDLALQTLVAVARECAPDLPEDLISRVYSIERAHQFDAANDREHASQSLLRLLEEFIAGSDVPRGSNA